MKLEWTSVLSDRLFLDLQAAYWYNAFPLYPAPRRPRRRSRACPSAVSTSPPATARHARTLFSADGSSVDDQVAELLGGRTIAVAESCTAGLMAARLAERPGSSAYLLGGVVSYSNASKVDQLGVDPASIERHGAVSPEVADEMARGALARFGADVALAITGIAGPGGGTEEKPVGTVCWCARRADGATLARDVRLPGDRTEVRDRSTTVGMHLLRRLLRGEEMPF